QNLFECPRAGVIVDLKHADHHHGHNQISSAPAAPLLNIGSDGLRHQSLAAHNILQTPPLQLGQRPSFFQTDDISYTSFVLFIVRVKFLGLGDDASIEGMRLFAHHFHHDRLLHAVGHYLAHHQFAATSA